ncbi:MAG: sugar ABC transporter permease, partial [Clostridia bacterium]|nr:sugar ABC transporter permease [Clostridia bacterium]
VTVVITVLLARLCALKKPGHSVYELLFALPMAVSMSAAALMFKMLLSPVASPINAFLGLNLDWLGNRDTAMWGIVSLTIWMGLGFNYLLFLSAFRNVSKSMLEAAQMDGAGPIRRFFHIELPAISPTLFYVICTNLVQAIMTSGPIIILTDGGPARSTTTMIFMMYSSGYGSSDYSLAACISLITFLMTLLFTIGAFALEGKKVQE